MPIATVRRVKKILLIDDEAAYVTGLAENLQDFGFQVSSALSGMEALKILEKEVFDLAILDLRMPRMDGFQVLEKIRENPKTKSLPVIVATAVSDTDTIFQARELGSVDYFIKPFNLNNLLNQIERVG